MHAFKIHDLTYDYHLLHLAISNCILPTTYKNELDGWYSRVLFAIGTGQRVCLARLYIEFLIVPTYHTTPIQHLKGAWAIHRVCDAAQIPPLPTDIPITGLGRFGEAAAL